MVGRIGRQGKCMIYQADSRLKFKRAGEKDANAEQGYRRLKSVSDIFENLSEYGCSVSCRAGTVVC